MIVEIAYLQAYQCDGCGRTYEMQRSFGREDDLNKRLDFKRRLERRHRDCVPKEVIDAMPVQGSVSR